jgi:uncharacterized protein YndB with AHSA1/START domain
VNADPVANMAVKVTAIIDAPIDEVWALLSDVERMAGLGPEHYAAAWVTTGPAVGATFTGRNRNGAMEWDVYCVITACRPPEYVEWTVGEAPNYSSVWSYELTEHPGSGTVVVQRFRHGPGFSYVRQRVDQEPEQAQAIIDGRSSTLHDGMKATLSAVGRKLESAMP